MKKNKEDIYELSKGLFGSISLTQSNETCFKFDKEAIEKNEKINNEFNTILNNIKNIKESINSILTFHSFKIESNMYLIYTELIKNNLSNMIEYCFKIFEIRKAFIKFNEFLKYCQFNKISLKNLQVSDLYVTKDNELKLFSLNYDSKVLRETRKIKYSDSSNNSPELKKNINSSKSEIWNIGIIMFYMYFGRYPKKGENKFNIKFQLFEDLLEKCLEQDYNKRIDWNDYFSHSFFHPEILFPNLNQKLINSFTNYKSYNIDRKKLSEYTNVCYEKIDNFIHIYDKDYQLIFSITNSFNFEIIFFKFERNKNLIIVKGEKLYIIKKNYDKSISLIQELNTINDNEFYSKIIEFPNGKIACLINEKEGIKKGKYIQIFSKIYGTKFFLELTLNQIKHPRNIYLTENNLFAISYENETLFYDYNDKMKLMKKIINEDSKIIYYYLNDNIMIKQNFSDFIIYNLELDEPMLQIYEEINCSCKLKDGSILYGGKNNNIYQIQFDEYGNVNLICKKNTDYGIWEDTLETPNKNYNIRSQRYYGIGKIEQFENGDILTISIYNEMPKLWKL